MSFGKVVGVFLLVCVIAVFIVGGCGYRGYNNAVGLDEAVKSAWAQVENQLQRRYDLIPNLVESVKGIAGQEQEVFLGIAKARESYFQARSTPEKAAAAGAYESALSRLLVLQEKYPDLRSNESFLKLQDEIAGTENRLGVERKRYNDQVKELNVFTRTLLGRLYASFAGVEKAEYFQIGEEAKATPKVDFSGPKKGG
ncbi:MAG: LemA family protein [Planctomycetota bacterium]